ncbi:pyrroline-5-carboxylate reductase dimerization-domain-containing protein [Mycena crocata]|nr:pyrroline-5-carboxylate reductase dimerization-domain-containing protein [Mycena crocata]
MTVVSLPPSPSTETDPAIILKIFSSIGRCRFLDEKHFDACTALSGSGPAFACIFLEAMADGGVMMGLPRAEALELAAQTLQGTARMSASVADLLALTDEFVLECASTGEPEVAVFQLEEQLHQIHGDVVDHASLRHTQVFLAVLHHLRPILPSVSIISSWFDLVLRPALREPKLPAPALNHAKELVVSALRKDDNRYADKVADFRRRLLDLYLLDAFNEGSGVDVLEWAELDAPQREKKTRWKANLEDILLKSGQERPEDLLTEINTHFCGPVGASAAAHPAEPPAAAVLAAHPLMGSLLNSLLVDRSSTLATIALGVLVKLLPILARQYLKLILPRLLAILARVLCWRERAPLPVPAQQSPELEVPAIEFDEVEAAAEDAGPVLSVREGLAWEVLELSFDTTAASAPSPRQYYTLLYYLNVLRFLRSPVLYLVSNNVESPYTVGWDAALDEQRIRSKSETLLRSHVCHPLIIWRDAAEEIARPDFWAEYDVARIASESMMLDVRNTALGLRERYQAHGLTANHRQSPSATPSISGSDDGGKTPMLTMGRTTTGETRISLKDMIATSLAISGLQREVLLLRNELNFELWLLRENVKHVGRLYQDRVLSRDAEVERQGLYYKLRKYRSQVATLEAELRTLKESASSTKERYADWNTELQKKLQDVRDQKKAWINEAAALRTADKEAKALFEAQGTLLAGASQEVFKLQTQQKESQHKIDRLHDYERQIEQHLKVQRLWDADFAKFTQLGEDMVRVKAEYRQMEMRLQCYEASQGEMSESARVYRRQIQALEAQLVQERRKTDHKVVRQPEEIATFVAEKKALLATNS